MTSKTPYNQRDHRHCWEQKNPPCGQKIEHLKCCLCELMNPKAIQNTPNESVEEVVKYIKGFIIENVDETGALDGKPFAVMQAHHNRNIGEIAKYVSASLTYLLSKAQADKERAVEEEKRRIFSIIDAQIEGGLPAHTVNTLRIVQALSTPESKDKNIFEDSGFEDILAPNQMVE